MKKRLPTFKSNRIGTLNHRLSPGSSNLLKIKKLCKLATGQIVGLHHCELLLRLDHADRKYLKQETPWLRSFSTARPITASRKCPLTRARPTNRSRICLWT